MWNYALVMTRKFAAQESRVVEVIKMSTYAIMVTIAWNHVASLLPLPLYLFQNAN